MNSTLNNNPYSIQANKIRTTLLLHSQSELLHYKHSKTRINSKSPVALLSKYDSIEIVIVNPPEQGNINNKPSHFIERRKRVSSAGTPCAEEIGNFVINLNRTLCSLRKLNHNDVINLKPISFHTQSRKIIHKKKLSRMKKSCQFLRRLAINFISRTSKPKSRKLSNQRMIKPPKMCFDFQQVNGKDNQYDGIATQRYNSKAKFNLNDPYVCIEPHASSAKNDNTTNNTANQMHQDNNNHHHHSATKRKTMNIFRTKTFLAQNKKEEENGKDDKYQDYRRNNNNNNAASENKYCRLKIEEEGLEMLNGNDNDEQNEFKQIQCFITNGRSLPFDFKTNKKLF